MAPPHRGHPPSAWRRLLAAQPSAVALPLSIALHVVILYAVSLISWVAPEPLRVERIAVLWLEEQPAPAEAVDPAALPALQPIELDPRPRLQEDPPSPAPDESEAVPEAPSDTAETDRAAAERAPTPSDDDEAGDRVAPEVDWEETRRQVIERMGEQRRLDESYTTFSLDDWIEEPPPEEPGPATPIFERCPVVTSRARQLAMRMVGLCFRTTARNDLFAHLKRDYMKARPVCEPVIDAAGNETQKCRLVVEEE